MPKIDFSKKGENTYFKTHNRLFFGYFFNRRPIWEPLISEHMAFVSIKCLIPVKYSAAILFRTPQAHSSHVGGNFYLVIVCEKVSCKLVHLVKQILKKKNWSWRTLVPPK